MEEGACVSGGTHATALQIPPAERSILAHAACGGASPLN
jgi:hypothetical protein